MNIIAITGRMTKEPEMRKTPGGKSVATISVAVERGFGQNKTTDFFDCVLWEQKAEFICKYAHKGNRIGVTGEMQSRQFQNQSGNHRVWEIISSSVELLESKQTNTQATPDIAFADDFSPVPDDFNTIADDAGDLPF